MIPFALTNHSRFNFIGYCLICTFIALSVACSGSKKNESTTPIIPVTPTSNSLGITAVPNAAPQAFRDNYVKYTSITAPNGGVIQFFAQNEISDEQIVRARSILQWYLTNVPLSTYGANKVPVANNMADNNAILILLNGSDDGEPPTDGQTLYQTENIVEGSTAYMANEPRDAAFEEILHLMHDTGIGVDGPNTFPGVAALAPYQNALRAATYNAISPGVNGVPIGSAQLNLWGGNELDWLNELAEENSLTQEYLASMIDVYYGLAGDIGNNFDVYTPGNRSEMQSQDPMGWALIGAQPLQYFSPFVNYTARIDSGFNGTFSLSFDATQNYTFKSRYLVNAQLTGNLDSNLSGNAHNNRLGGNAGDNVLDGGDGEDTATFHGIYSEYTVTLLGSEIRVVDTQSNRDGSVTLRNIELMQFTDVIAFADPESDSIEIEAVVPLFTIDQLPITAQAVVSNHAAGGNITFQLNFRDVIRLPDGTTRTWSAEEQEPYVAGANRWLEVLNKAGSLSNYMLEINIVVDDFNLGWGAANLQLSDMYLDGSHVFPSRGEFIVNNCLYIEVASTKCPEVLTGNDRLVEFDSNIRHEIGHILGIGSLWNLDSTEVTNNFDEADPGEGDFRNFVEDSVVHQGLIYRESHGVSAYNSFTGSSFDFAPVSDGHLYSDIQNPTPGAMRQFGDTVIPSLDTELMAHYNLFTPVLFGFLRDLGWIISDSPRPNEP